MFPTRHEPIRAVLVPQLNHTSRFKYNSNVTNSCGDDRQLFKSSANMLYSYFPSLLAAFLFLHLHLLGGSACGLGSTPHPVARASHSSQNGHPKLANREIGGAARDVWIRTPDNRRSMTVSIAASTPSDNALLRSKAVVRAPTLEAGAEIVRDFKMALAGAFAGAVATAFLFPIDTAKTLRQANPRTIHGTREALAYVWRTRGPLAIYTGLPTAIFGAMPSSALYFGTYEAVKTRLLCAAARIFLPGEGRGVAGNDDVKGSGGEGLHPAARAGAHAVAAACGNAASSVLFVPKEYVKQKIQASGMAAAGNARETAAQIVRRTLREKGICGLYCGYWATLSRNIPSAVIRFSVYEEIKLLLGPGRLMSTPPVYLLAGAFAGACASGLTTPFDVLKTRVATGSLDGSRGLAHNMASIVAESGWQGLFAGFQPRVVMSGLFTAVGFSSFETFKSMLGVSPLSPAETQLERRKAPLVETPSGIIRRRTKE